MKLSAIKYHAIKDGRALRSIINAITRMEGGGGVGVLVHFGVVLPGWCYVQGQEYNPKKMEFCLKEDPKWA